MSPDKAHTICVVAERLLSASRDRAMTAVGRGVPEKDATSLTHAEAVREANTLYDEAQRSVRASGPTSTEPCHCAVSGCVPCPRHPNA